MNQLCAVYGCKKSRTTPYHPQRNGACERFNRTLLSLLSTMDADLHAKWPSQLPALLQAYNNTTHSSTGMTPHYVLFGRHARLPVDVLHEVAAPQYRDNVEGWVTNHHRTLLQAYATVRNNVERRQQWNQTSFNRCARTLPLLPGERVLLRNFRRRAKGKLAPQWLPWWPSHARINPSLAFGPRQRRVPSERFTAITCGHALGTNKRPTEM